MLHRESRLKFMLTGIRHWARSAVEWLDQPVDFYFICLKSLLSVRCMYRGCRPLTTHFVVFFDKRFSVTHEWVCLCHWLWTSHVFLTHYLTKNVNINLYKVWSPNGSKRSNIIASTVMMDWFIDWLAELVTFDWLIVDWLIDWLHERILRNHSKFPIEWCFFITSYTSVL